MEAPPARGEGRTFIASSDPEKIAAWGNSSWWAGGRARCNHCGNQFSFRELPQADTPQDQSDTLPMTRKKTICPACGGTRFHTTSTQGGTQFRKCKDCKHTGKTAVAG